jgi:hypothetical protein
MKRLLLTVSSLLCLYPQNIDLSLSYPALTFIPSTSRTITWDDNVYVGFGFDVSLYTAANENIFFRLDMASAFQKAFYWENLFRTTEFSTHVMRKISNQAYIGIGLSYMQFIGGEFQFNPPEYFQNTIVISSGYVFYSSFMFDVKADIFLRDNPLKEIVPVSLSVGYFFGDYFK